MKLDLGNFLNGNNNLLTIEGELDLASIYDSGREVEITKPIVYRGEIFKMEGINYINCTITYEYSVQCDRCLAPAQGKIETTLSGRLVEGKVEDFEDESDEELIFYEDQVLDLKYYIESQVIISLPMKLLCTNECKGLCVECGANLNVDQCNCLKDKIDPRFAKLKNFFPKE